MERNAAQAIDDRRFGPLQIRIVVLAALVLVLDGYDMGTISSTAKAIALQMHRQVTGFGPVFACGFVGVLIGALAFGLLADRVGRKVTVVSATLAFGIFTLLTPLVHTYDLLIFMRIITGIGLGGAVPNAIALTSELVPSRARAFTVNGISAGIAAGGVLSPVLASWLLPHHGWKPIFVIGGIFPILLAIVMAFALPESRQFLAVRSSGRQARAPLAALFTRDRRVVTVMLWIMNFCTLTVALLMVSWLPTILELTGLSVTSSLLTASLLSAAGVVGTLLLGYTMVRRAPGSVLTVAFCCAAIGIVIFAFAGHSRAAVIIGILIAGFFLFGCQAAVNSVASSVYPTEVRSTGVGWVLGVGRVGSIVGPLIAGTILTSLLRHDKLFIIVAIPALVGAVAAFFAHRALTSHQPAQEEAEAVPAASS
jgi:MFS transporter, AAHS family, 4-hydroxybenzoate transporter